MPKMVRKKNSHRDYLQPMKWASMHPRGLVLFLLGRVGVLGFSLFPLNSILQHVPQIPNLFPNMP
jgi:hypothetical protein